MTVLLAFVAALGAACFAPDARAGEAGLAPPDCRALLPALDDPYNFPDEEGARTNWNYVPCVLWVFRALAEPYRADDFHPSAPMLDVWNRLDLRFVPWMPGGSHWGDLPEPVYLRDQASGRLAVSGFPEEEGAEPPDYELHPDHFDIAFKWDGRDRWYRLGYYRGRADWTGDGRADLLIVWEEDAALGTYLSSYVMVIAADGPGRALRAIHYKDWLLANADRVRPLLAPGKE